MLVRERKCYYYLDCKRVYYFLLHVLVNCCLFDMGAHKHRKGSGEYWRVSYYVSVTPAQYRCTCRRFLRRGVSSRCSTTGLQHRPQVTFASFSDGVCFDLFFALPSFPSASLRIVVEGQSIDNRKGKIFFPFLLSMVGSTKNKLPSA